jgi:hypothetical protein
MVFVVMVGCLEEVGRFVCYTAKLIRADAGLSLLWYPKS